MESFCVPENPTRRWVSPGGYREMPGMCELYARLFLDP